MSKFSFSLTMGLLCVGAAFSPALGAASPPNFSPNPSVGWVVVLGGLKPPLSGAGPVADDPAHPTINNNEFRITGRQPTFPVADLSNPILQPWVREALRERNEQILAGKPGFGPRQSCWPRGVPGFLLEGGFQPIFIIQSAKEVIMVAQADNHKIRQDRKSTRLNSSHGYTSYAAFCLKKKNGDRVPATNATNRRHHDHTEPPTPHT